MKLIIEATQNGYILTGKFNDSNLLSKVVIEEKSGEDAELLLMQDLLYAVKEYFGLYYSKHNEKNLVIEINKIRE